MSARRARQIFIIALGLCGSAFWLSAAADAWQTPAGLPPSSRAARNDQPVGEDLTAELVEAGDGLPLVKVSLRGDDHAPEADDGRSGGGGVA